MIQYYYHIVDYDIITVWKLIVYSLTEIISLCGNVHWYSTVSQKPIDEVVNDSHYSISVLLIIKSYY
jgi:hypothetical protein